MTLDMLIDNYKHKGFEKIDYLKIDAEGHETNILDAYSWKIKPSFIKIIESNNITVVLDVGSNSGQFAKILREYNYKKKNDRRFLSRKNFLRGCRGLFSRPSYSLECNHTLKS